MSRKVTEAAGTPEETQTTQEAGPREVSRRESLELRRFPPQEIPQHLTYR